VCGGRDGDENLSALSAGRSTVLAGSGTVVVVVEVGVVEGMEDFRK